MNDLIKQFPDATRQNKKRPQIENTPDHPGFTLRTVIGIAIVTAIVFVVSGIGIALVIHFSQKFNW